VQPDRRSSKKLSATRSRFANNARAWCTITTSGMASGNGD